MLNQHFFVPWSEIDPTLRHGGIPGGLEGFVGPNLGDNPRTKNMDLITIFQVVNEVGASLSQHPEADLEGPPSRGPVEETLRAINWILERIQDRTRASSMTLFAWTHATPPFQTYLLRPVRYPLRNVFLNQAAFIMVGTLVEIAEANANGVHANFDPSSAGRIAAPVLELKTQIILDYFDLEIQGMVSADELGTMFAGKTQPGPTIVPQSESSPRPEDEEVEEAQAGVSLIQWFPTSADWQVFGKKRDERYKPERIWQPEGARWTTEDFSPHSGVPAGGAPPGTVSAPDTAPDTTGGGGSTSPNAPASGVGDPG